MPRWWMFTFENADCHPLIAGYEIKSPKDQKINQNDHRTTPKRKPDCRLEDPVVLDHAAKLQQACQCTALRSRYRCSDLPGRLVTKGVYNKCNTLMHKQAPVWRVLVHLHTLLVCQCMAE